MIDERRHGIAQCAIEDENARTRHQRSQRDSFFHARDEEGVAARTGKGLGHCGCTKTIGIGLDDAGHRSGSGQTLAESIVRDDCTQPHRQARRWKIRMAHGRTMTAWCPDVKVRISAVAANEI